MKYNQDIIFIVESNRSSMVTTPLTGTPMSEGVEVPELHSSDTDSSTPLVKGTTISSLCGHAR